jgi:Predicted signal transduction protein with a C-terminal ATPase domain
MLFEIYFNYSYWIFFTFVFLYLTWKTDDKKRMIFEVILCLLSSLVLESTMGKLNIEYLIGFVLLLLIPVYSGYGLTDTLFCLGTSYILVMITVGLTDILLPELINMQNTDSSIVMFLYIFISLFILFIEGWLVKHKLMPYLREKNDFKPASYLLYLFVLILACYQTFENTINPSGESNKGDDIVIASLAVILCFLVMVILLSIYHLHKNQSLALELERKNLEQEFNQIYTAEISRQYEGMRKFRHDYNNIMNSLKYYIDQKDLESLTSYFEREIYPSKDKLNEATKRFSDINNIGAMQIKSLFLSKLSLNSDVIYKFEIPDQVLPLSPRNSLDIVRILGIFIDNAIEEAEENDGEVDIAIFGQQDDVQIVISNAYNDKGLSIKQMREKGISTKGSNRGLGLHNVEEILAKSDNLLLETKISKEKFIQILTVLGGNING